MKKLNKPIEKTGQRAHTEQIHKRSIQMADKYMKRCPPLNTCDAYRGCGKQVPPHTPQDGGAGGFKRALSFWKAKW